MTNQRSSVYLSLGANIGNRLQSLRKAVHCLDVLDGVRVCKMSRIYETAPWGLTDQPEFLNMAVMVDTVLSPLDFLHAIQLLETRLGRQPDVRWGPRAIDIDIILWDSLMMRTSELTVPHEYFRERYFVLAPLAEIAPDVVDPETGNTITGLLNNLDPHALSQCNGVIYS